MARKRIIALAIVLIILSSVSIFAFADHPDTEAAITNGFNRLFRIFRAIAGSLCIAGLMWNAVAMFFGSNQDVERRKKSMIYMAIALFLLLSLSSLMSWFKSMAAGSAWTPPTA